LDQPQRQHRVVVIGAGFGGLRVARGLRDAPVEVTIVDANNFHTFQPLLYQVATAGLDTDDIAYPVRGIFRRQRNVHVRMATVIGADLTARRITTDRGAPLDFDTLVVAAGTISHDFGTPGVAQHTYPLKTAADAIALRNHLLARFEDAALGDHAADPGAGMPHALDVVVCGGGPTGVEMAGGLAELYQRVLAKDFPQLDVAGARITLVEAAPYVLLAATFLLLVMWDGRHTRSFRCSRTLPARASRRSPASAAGRSSRSPRWRTPRT